MRSRVKEISIAKFRQAIERLPSDKPVIRAGVWYTTQKQHWLGWLGEYEGPGAYGRRTNIKRDARFAYNHVVCPELLLYLARAIPLQAEMVRAAEDADQRGTSLMQRAGAIRKVISWPVIYQALWGSEQPNLFERLKSSSAFNQINRALQRRPSQVKNEPAEPGLVQNRALSIRQPYVEQILRGIKKVEYRSVPTNIRGRVYLYASLTPSLEAFEEMGAKPGDFPTGLLVGTVEIVDCTGGGKDYQWHLAHPERLAQPIAPQTHPQPVWFKPFTEQPSINTSTESSHNPETAR